MVLRIQNSILTERLEAVRLRPAVPHVTFPMAHQGAKSVPMPAIGMFAQLVTTDVAHFRV